MSPHASMNEEPGGTRSSCGLDRYQGGRSVRRDRPDAGCAAEAAEPGFVPPVYPYDKLAALGIAGPGMLHQQIHAARPYLRLRTLEKHTFSTEDQEGRRCTELKKRGCVDQTHDRDMQFVAKAAAAHFFIEIPRSRGNHAGKGASRPRDVPSPSGRQWSKSELIRRIEMADFRPEKTVPPCRPEVVGSRRFPSHASTFGATRHLVSRNCTSQKVRSNGWKGDGFQAPPFPYRFRSHRLEEPEFPSVLCH